MFNARGDGGLDGALAEVRVAGWHQISRGRAERVVLGPGGLLVLVERHGRVRDEWADEARVHAQVIERMTDRPVGLLVVLSRSDWTGARPFRGATLLPVSGLADHLAGLPRLLAPADIDVLRARMQRALAV
jgi:hypothetical protein